MKSLENFLLSKSHRFHGPAPPSACVIAALLPSHWLCAGSILTTQLTHQPSACLWSDFPAGNNHRLYWVSLQVIKFEERVRVIFTFPNMTGAFRNSSLRYLPEVGKLLPEGQVHLLPTLRIKFYWNTALRPCSRLVLAPFPQQSSGCFRDHRTHKDQNTYYLALRTKSWPTLIWAIWWFTPFPFIDDHVKI